MSGIGILKCAKEKRIGSSYKRFVCFSNKNNIYKQLCLSGSRGPFSKYLGWNIPCLLRLGKKKKTSGTQDFSLDLLYQKNIFFTMERLNVRFIVSKDWNE